MLELAHDRYDSVGGPSIIEVLSFAMTTTRVTDCVQH